MVAFMKILLDTNTYVAFKRGNPEVLEVLQQACQIGLCSVVLGELLAGFALGNRESRNLEELNEFLQAPRVVLFTVDEVTAKYYAKVYKQLRAQGQPIPTNDLWIAAIALQHSFALLSYDQHFLNVEDLLWGQKLSDFR
jgi:predicted nucleic acid-binding protein